MKISYRKLFIQVLFFCGFYLNICAHKGVAFDDFDSQKDTAFLEYLFKKDYVMLKGDHLKDPYKEGKGVELFKNLVSDAKTDERKILRIDDQSVAFLIFFIAQNNKNFDHLNDGDGVLVLMGVHPDHRQKGYGKLVIQHLLTRFEELGCQRGWLSVNKDNIKAQSLYKKFGFQNTQKVSWGQSYWWMVDLKKKNFK